MHGRCMSSSVFKTSLQTPSLLSGGVLSIHHPPSTPSLLHHHHYLARMVNANAAAAAAATLEATRGADVVAVAPRPAQRIVSAASAASVAVEGGPSTTSSGGGSGSNSDADDAAPAPLTNRRRSTATKTKAKATAARAAPAPVVLPSALLQEQQQQQPQAATSSDDYDHDDGLPGSCSSSLRDGGDSLTKSGRRRRIRVRKSYVVPPYERKYVQLSDSDVKVSKNNRSIYGSMDLWYHCVVSHGSMLSYIMLYYTMFYCRSLTQCLIVLLQYHCNTLSDGPWRFRQ